jgi:6-phosphogluconolactonase
MKLALTRLAALTFFLVSTHTMANTSLLYIGTQNPEKMGILAVEFDDTTGTFGTPSLAAETRDPAHFAVTRGHLYICNTGTPGGVSAFAIADRKTGALRFLNSKESRGRGPSFIGIDATGRYVLDANYGGGYVEVFSLAADGSLDAQTAMVEHTGSSVHPQRQTKPYAHWFHTDPTNQFGLVADLGTDQIVVYRFDARTGKLAPNDPPFVKVAPGAGPRHLAFHPNGRWVYAIAELANEVMAFNWDAQRGALAQFQSVKTLADTFTGPSTAAEIAIHRNGQFLYASNRGEDSLVVYAIDPRSGELALRQRVASGGKVPRFFALDPTNKWLVAGNQESANVVLFAVDPATGELTPHGAPLAVPKPMGIVFAPR